MSPDLTTRLNLLFSATSRKALDLEFVQWTPEKKFDYKPEEHNVFFFRSFRILALMCKHHFVALASSNLTLIINTFGRFFDL